MLEGYAANEKNCEFLLARHSGQVSAVFSSGVYIILDDRLLLIHDMKAGALPFGIAVEGLEGRGRELGLEAGMKFFSAGSVIFSEDRCFELSVKGRSVIRTAADCSLLPLFAEKAVKELESSGKTALSIFAAADPEEISKESIEDIFASAALSPLSLLTKSMDSNDAEMMEAALMKLIGLGRGLTPSLDDFICGSLFLLHYAEEDWGMKLQFLPALSHTVIKLAAQRTNKYSALYLCSSARGEDFSLMRECIESAGKDGFEKSVGALLAVGASSGADMLSGMCFAANHIIKHQVNR